MSFNLPLDYNDVASRIVDFRTKHPDGSLQQVDLQFIDFGGQSWVVYTAAAFRDSNDIKPGMGTAWEPVPGKTPYTKDSELQNAETAAWGRAIVAVLASDTKKGVASAEEVRNRQSVNEAPVDAMSQARIALADAWAEAGNPIDPDKIAAAYEEWSAQPFGDAKPDDLLSFARVLRLPKEPEQEALIPDET
jgi:hypothetical protein